MPAINIFLRTNKAGVERALHHARAIGVGPHALRDAAQHLLRTGVASADDALRLFRGCVFMGTVNVTAAAGAA